MIIFKDYLQSASAEIEQEINRFFSQWGENVSNISLNLVPLYQEFVESCQGGKRIRGSLVKLGYGLAAKKDNPEILKPAIAYEIFQTAILAHDDIIDLSDLRRGKPTLWKSLGGNHYGISQTICLGDIGFFLAQKLIAESSFPEDRKNQAIRSFINTVLDTALGEVLDVELPYQSSHMECGKIAEKDILTIFTLKTAKYTIVGPMQLGAVLGGASQKLLDDIGLFGQDLGIAFQIQDDILGIFGEEEVVGKSITSDIKEGKITLLYLIAYQNGTKDQKEILKKYYGKGKIGRVELDKIRQVFMDTGALFSSQQKAGKLVKKSKEVILKMDISEDQKGLLSGMSDFLVKRDK